MAISRTAAAGSNGPRPPALSSKRAKFVEVVTPRLKNAANALYVLGQCADFNRYEILPEDVEYIKKEIGGEFRRMMEAYEGGGRKERVRLPGT
jgi:hypothetical protein